MTTIFGKPQIFNLTQDGLKKVPTEEVQRIFPALTLFVDENGSKFIAIEQSTASEWGSKTKLVRQLDYKAELEDYDLEKMVYHTASLPRPISKKFGIGIYYYDDLRQATQDELLTSLEMAERITEAQKAKREAESQAFQKAVDEMPSLYPHLKPLGNNYDYKGLRANILSHLEHSFPGIRFSIKKSSYDCINIEWKNGPTVESVNKISDLFKSGNFNGMEDIYEYKSSPFKSTFGSLKYIFLQREFTPELEEICKTWDDKHGTHNRSRHLSGNPVHTTDLPAKAINLRIHGDKLLFDTPAPEIRETRSNAPKTSEKGIIEEVNGITVWDYSEKAILLTGNTKNFRDQLKPLGIFRPFWEQGAGWMVSKKHFDKVMSIIKK